MEPGGEDEVEEEEEEEEEEDRGGDCAGACLQDQLPSNRSRVEIVARWQRPARDNAGRLTLH